MRIRTFQMIAAAAMVALTTLAAPVSASSDDVQVKTMDGMTTLTGKLVSYSDGVYVIQTKLGTFEVEIEKSTCEGLGCPFVMT